MTRTGRAVSIALLLALAGGPPAGAQEPTAPAATRPGAAPANAPAPEATPDAAPARRAGAIDRTSIIREFTRTNPVLWALGLCSVFTIGFALERTMALRRARVIPRDFVNRFHERLAGGKLDRDRAAELCRANESPAARVFAEVVRHWGQPPALIRQAVSQGCAGEVVDLKRNIRMLNGTATLAPLLGLLGTVIGMIESFAALGGKVGPAKGEALAQGISLALVATAIGLGIAIVSVIFYYALQSKVDVLLRELDNEATRAIDLIAVEPIRPLPDRRTHDTARHESRGY